MTCWRRACRPGKNVRLVLGPLRLRGWPAGVLSTALAEPTRTQELSIILGVQRPSLVVWGVSGTVAIGVILEGHCENGGLWRPKGEESQSAKPCERLRGDGACSQCSSVNKQF